MVFSPVFSVILIYCKKNKKKKKKILKSIFVTIFQCQYVFHLFIFMLALFFWFFFTISNFFFFFYHFYSWCFTPTLLVLLPYFIFRKVSPFTFFFFLNFILKVFVFKTYVRYFFAIHLSFKNKKKIFINKNTLHVTQIFWQFFLNLHLT